MTFGKRISLWLAAVLAALLAGCSGGGSDDASATNSIASVQQDLTVDPDGLTTVVAFTENPGGAAVPGAFSASGGQTAVTAVRTGNNVRVTWNSRVTPSHTVTVTGVPGVNAVPNAVTTTDATSPTLTFTSATQTAGLGSDSLTVTFTGGPRVVEASAEDPANWDLVQNAASVPLTGTVINFDSATQTAVFSFASNTNLHSAFTISAATLTTVADVVVDPTPAAGAPVAPDVTAPTLVSAVQDLGADSFGRVIDFTFSEAMDPFFAVRLPNFDAGGSTVATNVQQFGAGTILRVTFSAPVVPTVDTVTLTGVMDAHGNLFPAGPQAIAQGSTVANAYDGTPVALAVSNEDGDYLTVTTTQAFDPEDAILPARWTLLVDGAPVDLTLHTLSYDLLSRTMRVDFTGFELPFGVAVSLTGNNVLDVDGQTFSLATAFNVSGDNVVPAVTAVVQNRSAAPDGTVLDVTMSEDLDQTTAETAGNWSLTGGINVLTATLLPNLNSVQLTLDATAVPGDVTLSVNGVADLALNTIAVPDAGNALTSSDSTAPVASTPNVEAVEGAENDRIVTTFSDDMVQSEVEDETNWVFESPAGVAVDPTGATVSYNTVTRTATLTFDAGNPEFVKVGDSFLVAFTTMRDIGGNTVDPTPFVGTVTGETNLPSVHTIWRDGSNNGEVVVRFSEHCDNLDDLYAAGSNEDGTRYILRTSGGTFRGYATGATILDGGLGARVGFGVLVDPTDTVDVLGVTDLAGNVQFPQMTIALAVEDDGLPPNFSDGNQTVTAVTGESNDVLTVLFDRPMSPWDLMDPANYTVTRDSDAAVVDLTGARFSFDGTSTVTIDLQDDTANDVLHGDTYDLSVQNVWSAQGAELTVADTELNVLADGDGDAGAADNPDATAGFVTVDPVVANSLLIVSDEALDQTEAETAANYDYNGGNVAVSATLLSPRVVRATFGVAPIAGNNVDITLQDKAGNNSGVLTRTVSAADAAAPLVGTVAGFAAADAGGDYVTVQFNEQVDLTSALSAVNYQVTNGATPISLSGASLTYDSVTTTVTIHLPAGQELDVTATPLTVTVQNISDPSGNTMAAPVSPTGVINGDSTPPDFDRSFINYREDASGLTVDVLFTEDVDAAFAGDFFNWVPSGGQFVLTATVLSGKHVRVTLNSALLPTETLDLTGLPDLAGNTSGLIQTEPTP